MARMFAKMNHQLALDLERINATMDALNDAMAASNERLLGNTPVSIVWANPKVGDMFNDEEAAAWTELARFDVSRYNKLSAVVSEHTVPEADHMFWHTPKASEELAKIVTQAHKH